MSTTELPLLLELVSVSQSVWLEFKSKLSVMFTLLFLLDFSPLFLFFFIQCQLIAAAAAADDDSMLGVLQSLVRVFEFFSFSFLKLNLPNMDN